MPSRGSRDGESREGKTHLGKEDRADERIVLESIQDSDPFDLRCGSVDEGLSELDGVGLREEMKGKGKVVSLSSESRRAGERKEKRDEPRARRRYPRRR